MMTFYNYGHHLKLWYYIWTLLLLTITIQWSHQYLDLQLILCHLFPYYCKTHTEIVNDRMRCACSWLIAEKRHLYDLSDVERLELEQLCHQVAPESYSRIMREFRSALLREPSANDLPHIMRAIVCRVIGEQRSTTDVGSASSLSRWLSQSWSSLRSRFVETTPLVSGSDGMEMSANVVDSMELGSLSDSDVWSASLHCAS